MRISGFALATVVAEVVESTSGVVVESLDAAALGLAQDNSDICLVAPGVPEAPELRRFASPSLVITVSAGLLAWLMGERRLRNRTSRLWQKKMGRATTRAPKLKRARIGLVMERWKEANVNLLDEKKGPSRPPLKKCTD